MESDAGRVSWWDVTLGDISADAALRKRAAEQAERLRDNHIKLGHAFEKHEGRKLAEEERKEREEREQRRLKSLADQQQAREAATRRALQLKSDPGALTRKTTQRKKPALKKPEGGAWARLRSMGAADGSTDKAKVYGGMVERLKAAREQAALVATAPPPPSDAGAAGSGSSSSSKAPAPAPAPASRPRTRAKTPASRARTPTWDEDAVLSSEDEALNDSPLHLPLPSITEASPKAGSTAAGSAAAGSVSTLPGRPANVSLPSPAAAMMATSISLPELGSKLRGGGGEGGSSSAKGAGGPSAALGMWGAVITAAKQQSRLTQQLAALNPHGGGGGGGGGGGHEGGGVSPVGGTRRRTRVSVIKEMKLPVKSAADVRHELSRAYVDTRIRRSAYGERHAAAVRGDALGYGRMRSSESGEIDHDEWEKLTAELPPAIRKMPPNRQAAAEGFTRWHCKRLNRANTLLGALNDFPTNSEWCVAAARL